MNLVFPVVFERSQQTVGDVPEKQTVIGETKHPGAFLSMSDVSIKHSEESWHHNLGVFCGLSLVVFFGLGDLSFGRYRVQMVISVLLIVKKCWSFIDSRWRACPQCPQINCVSSHCIHEWLSVELKACNMIIGQITRKEITLHWAKLKMSPVLYRLVMEEMMTSMFS